MTKKLFLTAIFGLFASSAAFAANDCNLVPQGTTLALQNDCTTDASLTAPSGWTFDGNGFMVTAVDPPAGHFLGGVIQKYGGSMNVKNVIINAGNLANVCDGGNDRLRGVLLDDAAGSVTKVTIRALNQGPSGCQEGNAIEARNFTSATRHKVEIANNNVAGWQKGGIIVNGTVEGYVHHNKITPSLTQDDLAPNSLQFGFGANGLAEHNDVGMNTWQTDPNWASTGILLYQSDGTIIRRNNLMEGNADVGIYIFANGTTVDNNRVFESGTDGAFDIGIGDYGLANKVTNNKVSGFAIPYDGVTNTGHGKGSNKQPRPVD